MTQPRYQMTGKRLCDSSLQEREKVRGWKLYTNITDMYCLQDHGAYSRQKYNETCKWEQYPVPSAVWLQRKQVL